MILEECILISNSTNRALVRKYKLHDSGEIFRRFQKTALDYTSKYNMFKLARDDMTQYCNAIQEGLGYARESLPGIIEDYFEGVKE